MRTLHKNQDSVTKSGHFVRIRTNQDNREKNQENHENQDDCEACNNAYKAEAPLGINAAYVWGLVHCKARVHKLSILGVHALHAVLVCSSLHADSTSHGETTGSTVLSSV